MAIDMHTLPSYLIPVMFVTIAISQVLLNTKKDFQIYFAWSCELIEAQKMSQIFVTERFVPK